VEPTKNPRKTYVGRRDRMTVDDWLALGWDQEDAERLAHEPRLDGSANTMPRVIVVTTDDLGTPVSVEPLRHHSYHSPTGFEWGYAGSGPAELARCILIDHLDLHERAEEEGGNLVLPVSHQSFKFDRIARLARDAPWSISSEQIEEWMGL
jgi:hypothetical protein